MLTIPVLRLAIVEVVGYTRCCKGGPICSLSRDKYAYPGEAFPLTARVGAGRSSRHGATVYDVSLHRSLAAPFASPKVRPRRKHGCSLRIPFRSRCRPLTRRQLHDRHALRNETDQDKIESRRLQTLVFGAARKLEPWPCCGLRPGQGPASWRRAKIRVTDLSSCCECAVSRSGLPIWRRVAWGGCASAWGAEVREKSGLLTVSLTNIISTRQISTAFLRFSRPTSPSSTSP